MWKRRQMRRAKKQCHLVTVCYRLPDKPPPVIRFGLARTVSFWLSGAPPRDRSSIVSSLAQPPELSHDVATLSSIISLTGSDKLAATEIYVSPPATCRPPPRRFQDSNSKRDRNACRPISTGFACQGTGRVSCRFLPKRCPSL